MDLEINALILWRNHTKWDGVAISLFTHIHYAFSLHLDRDIDYSPCDISLLSLVYANVGTAFRLGHDRFVPNPFNSPVIIPFRLIVFSYYRHLREVTHKVKHNFLSDVSEFSSLSIDKVLSIFCASSLRLIYGTWRDNFQIKDAFINCYIAKLMVY
jgi:hypothetical protein